MASTGVWQSLRLNDQREPWYIVFEALMASDRPDLSSAIEYVSADDLWPDAFRTGLEALQAYRLFYGPRLFDCPPDERAKIEAYDEEWTMELIDMFHKHQFGSLQTIS